MTGLAPARRPAEGPSGDPPITLRCHGCGYRAPSGGPLVTTCPERQPGDDVDHVLRRHVDPSRLEFPADGERNPFVRYRRLLSGYHRALADGGSDGEAAALIRRLDRAVASVAGHGFVATPERRAPELAARLGLHGTRLWVKDETGNVSGSHKARHLFGTAIELSLAGEPDQSDRPLAIASCGNAALAAAVVARALDRRLRVFIPPDAPRAVVARLRELAADVVVCQRADGERGDPTYRRLLESLAAGAFPFTCQGNLNGLAIEGGMTLGWELVADLSAQGATIDHLVIQVGGGALASACIQALEEAVALGALQRMPKVHAVQTAAAYPLARAHRRLAAELGAAPNRAAVEAAVEAAAQRRSRYMWPWERDPRSVATGILDDETYDWLQVVRGMLLTGGMPVVVDERSLRDANRLARDATGIDVDHTGSAGLAGLAELIRRGEIGPGESAAVIFTGIRRQSPANGVHP